MRKNTMLYAVVGAAAIAVAYIGYKNFFWSKKLASDYLVKKTNSNRDILNAMDKGYVISLAKARRSGKSTFSYRGKKYNTATGRGEK